MHMKTEDSKSARPQDNTKYDCMINIHIIVHIFLYIYSKTPLI